MIGYIGQFTNQFFGKGKQKKQVVGTSITIIWTAILFIFVFVPTLRSALDANKRIQEAQKIDSDLSLNVSALQQASVYINQEKETRVLVDAAVPGTPKTVTLVNEIDLANANSGLFLEVLDMGVASGATTGGPKGQQKVNALQKNSIPFSIQAKGTYLQIKAFIERLEKLPILVDLQKVTIAALDERELSQLPNNGLDSNGNELLELNISGTAYHQNLNEE